jgi:hypothetical protein
MKTIHHSRRSRDPLLHVETDFGIVNIHVGLHDADGNPVTAVTIIPDRVDWDHEDRRIELDGYSNNRLIAKKENAR